MSSNVVDKTYGELRAFIQAHAHMNSTELVQSARNEIMTTQWKILRDAEKDRMGNAFSEVNWKRALMVHLAPGRFAHGGDRVSHPEQNLKFQICPVRNSGASVMKDSYSLWKTASRQPLPMRMRKP